MATSPRDLGTAGTAPTRDERRRAWMIALAADFVQIVAMPLFFGGALSPANNLLDVIVAFALIRLLGWHPVFLPAFVAEMLPGIDVAPTWTIAVFLATRFGGREVRPAPPEPNRAEVVEERPKALPPSS